MSKILININNLEEVNEYKKIGITNFLFAINDYSIGYNAFDIDGIPKDAYILMNRVLDTKDIECIKNIKNKLLKFKGIIFEDIGVYNIFKNDDIELIWNQAHFATNTSSINFWLDKVNSAVISNEITREEIENIVNNVNKPVVLNVFGKNNIMYSRRTLLSNFNKYNNLEDNKKVVLKENVSKNEFYAEENQYGTFIMNNEYFNYNGKLNVNDDNIKFYLYLNKDLSIEDMIEVINGKNIGNDGFLNKKTVYKLKDYKTKETRGDKHE